MVSYEVGQLVHGYRVIEVRGFRPCLLSLLQSNRSFVLMTSKIIICPFLLVNEPVVIA